MEIKSEPGLFYIEKDHNLVAEIVFNFKDDQIIDITHTYVADELRGRGIAGKLMKKVIELAQNSQAKIIPTCSFAQKFFLKHPEYQEIRY